MRRLLTLYSRGRACARMYPTYSSSARVARSIIYKWIMMQSERQSTLADEVWATKHRSCISPHASDLLTLTAQSFRMSKSIARQRVSVSYGIGSTHFAFKRRQNEQIQCPTANFGLTRIKFAHSGSQIVQNERIRWPTTAFRLLRHPICSLCI